MPIINLIPPVLRGTWWQTDKKTVRWDQQYMGDQPYDFNTILLNATDDPKSSWYHVCIRKMLYQLNYILEYWRTRFIYASSWKVTFQNRVGGKMYNWLKLTAIKSLGIYVNYINLLITVHFRNNRSSRSYNDNTHLRFARWPYQNSTQITPITMTVQERNTAQCKK